MTNNGLSRPARRLTFIHTVPALEPVFAALASERLDGWQIAAVADESLLTRTIERGYVDEEVLFDLNTHVQKASADGSDAIVVTCSTLGEAVDKLARKTVTPLYRIDRGMAEQAVQQASSIGILATLPTTLDPTTRLIKATAQRAGRHCTIVSKLCAEAFDCLRRGDNAQHDELVRRAFEDLSGEVQLVVLAQASMARALEREGADKRYLTSPELGMDHIAGLIRLSRMSDY
jgi:aspartate/glutamate racemase